MANPAAARGRTLGRVEHVANRLRARTSVQIHIPGSVAETSELIGELADHRVERVVVLGGDGIVHLAANELAGTETVLGVVAGGTGNDTASGVGLPQGIEEATNTALAEPQAIDVIESPAGIGVTVAAVGFAVAVNERADAMGFPRGASRYTIAALAELVRLKTHLLELTIDGTEHQVEANMVAVANTDSFGGGMRVAPDADPTDGRLEVLVMGPAGPLAFGALLPTVFVGAHVHSRHVRTLSGSEITIGAPGADHLPVRVDGEPFGSTPTTLRVRPGSLLIAGARP